MACTGPYPPPPPRIDTSNVRFVIEAPIKPPRLLGLPPAYPGALAPVGAAVQLTCRISEAGAATRCVATGESNPVARDAAIAWATSPSTRFQPAEQSGKPVSVEHALLIGFFMGAGNDAGGFSEVLETRSCFPHYPLAYADASSRNGTVEAEYRVGTDGLPHDTRLLRVVGGDAFGDAVKEYLVRGCFHILPKFRDGNPVDGRTRSTKIEFKSPDRP